MELLLRDWERRLRRMVEDASEGVYFICPFVTAVALPLFRGARARGLRCRLVTRLNKADLWRRASRGDVLEELIRLGVEVRALRGLHAKLFLFDRARAVVTSANLTDGGLRQNHEAGVLLEGDESRPVAEHAEGIWSGLTATLTAERMREVNAEVERFRSDHPEAPVELPAPLTDEGEVLAGAEPYPVALRPDVRPESALARFEQFRAAHRQVGESDRAETLRGELERSGFRGISTHSYLWLLGWCNTDPHTKKTAMARARGLAEALFGYAPPEVLEVGERRHRAKGYRYGPSVPYEADILAYHRQRLDDARERDRGAFLAEVERLKGADARAAFALALDDLIGWSEGRGGSLAFRPNPRASDAPQSTFTYVLRESGHVFWQVYPRQRDGAKLVVEARPDGLRKELLGRFADLSPGGQPDSPELPSLSFEALRAPDARQKVKEILGATLAKVLGAPS